MEPILCPVCFSENSKNWIVHERNDQIVECINCGCGFVSPYCSVEINQYEDYGDYITKLPKNYFEKRLKLSLAKILFFSALRFFLNRSSSILDYGGGAGFFVHSARLMGFEQSYIFEPSQNFRKAAVEEVGLPKFLVKKALNEIDFKCDFVCMLDVIEHLPEGQIHQLIGELTKKMKSGSFLFGETPNKNSLNIRLFGEKDPVITPPSHVLYFTKNSLDVLLRKNGFKRKFIITKGLSTNAFFRKSKFVPSFVEMPNTQMEKLFSIIIRIMFKFGSIPLSFLGLGYQIVFLYQLVDTPKLENENL